MSSKDSAQSSGRLRRWAQMKSEELDQQSVPEAAIIDGVDHQSEAEAEAVVLCDNDMPNLSLLDDHSDYSSFLSEGVSKGLRKVALQQLFRASKFNVVDGLDDYAEDYTQFEPLGDIITADMKHSMERAKQALAELMEDEPDADSSTDSTADPADQEEADKPLVIEVNSEHPDSDGS